VFAVFREYAGARRADQDQAYRAGWEGAELMASSLIGSLRVALSLGTADFRGWREQGGAHCARRRRRLKARLPVRRPIEGLFAAFTVGLLTEQVKKSLEYAGSLAEVSRTLGVTTKDLQTFRFAATQSGVAQDQLEVGLRRLTVSMGKASSAAKEQAKAFNAIGISLDELKGKNTGEVFRLMADGLSKVTDRSQRAAIEMTLMGRSGSTLDNLLAPGARRLNELAEAAQRLGIVLSDSRFRVPRKPRTSSKRSRSCCRADRGRRRQQCKRDPVAVERAGDLTGSDHQVPRLQSAARAGIVGGWLGGRFGGLPGAIAGAAGGLYPRRQGRSVQRRRQHGPGLPHAADARAQQQHFLMRRRGCPVRTANVGPEPRNREGGQVRDGPQAGLLIRPRLPRGAN
jgi:hypothetical protein